MGYVHVQLSSAGLFYTPKKHNLCLLQLDWDNIYLEWDSEEREAKVESISQIQIIAFGEAYELRQSNMQRGSFWGESISKLSFTSEIPFITDISGGLYDVVCSTGRNKIRLSDIHTKGLRCDGSRKSIHSYTSNKSLRCSEVYHRKIVFKVQGHQ